MWKKKDSDTYYLELLESIKGRRVINPYIKPFTDKKRYWIRHDVDYNLDHALALGEFENKKEVQEANSNYHFKIQPQNPKEKLVLHKNDGIDMKSPCSLFVVNIA